MDIQIRNYILYKARTFEQRKKELQLLKKHYEEMKLDIIEETTGSLDGLPRGKGGKSDPTQSKVLRFEQLNKRIDTLDKEIKAFERSEEKINIMGSLARRIYKETIRGQSNLEYKAMEYGMATRTLYNFRSKLIEMIAEDLGEYINIDKL